MLLYYFLLKLFVEWTRARAISDIYQTFCANETKRQQRLRFRVKVNYIKISVNEMPK